MTVHDRHADRPEPQGGNRQSSSKSQSRSNGEKDKRGKTDGRPKVLARLPDLDINELDRIVDADPPVEGKRPLTQRISTAALIGVGALFVMVAIQPYVGKRERGLQPPAPAAPAAPAWDASAARMAPATPAQQAQTVTPVPVSIPALPTSIPAVPESLQAPTAPSTGPNGLPAPSFNKHSQASPTGEPGLAEISSNPVVSPIAPSAAGAAPVIASTPAPVTPTYPVTSAQSPVYGAPGQAMVNQAVALQPSSVAMPAYPQTSAPPVYPVTGFAGSPNTAVNLNGYVAPAQPGVAQFQGVIEKSTQRPTYDTSRSSLR